MELFEKIRREYKLGVHRRMVREAIRNAVPAQRKKIQREPTRLVREVVLFKVDDNACVRVKHNRYPFLRAAPPVRGSRSQLLKVQSGVGQPDTRP